MPRIRSIYPEACRSRKLAALTPAAERCWWRLQTHLDDHGRAEDEPDIFASVLFQVMRDVTPGMVDSWLWEMAEAGLIVRYEAGGTPYLEVVRWGDFQHPQKPKPSPIPPAQSASTRRVRDEAGTPLPLFADGVDGMGEETDVGAEGESEGEAEAPRPEAPSVDNSPSPLRERLRLIESSPPQWGQTQERDGRDELGSPIVASNESGEAS